MNKQKLELTWIGKDKRPRLEPRIFLEDKGLSYQVPSTATSGESDVNRVFNDNLLIHGDNLLALKALEQQYAGKVKCVFIDPPYNTGSAFGHYDDGVEHSLWLTLMRDRLELLHSLLDEKGSVWISIDDNEMAYLKIIMDEIFGRSNFITTICWEKIYTLKNTAKHFSTMHDFILIYAKNISNFEINQLPRTEKQNKNFKNTDNDTRGPWIDSAMHARNFYSKGTYEVISPSGKSFTPPPGRYWSVSKENFDAIDRDNRIWWGKDGNNAPRKKTFLTDVKQGVVPGTIWGYEDAGQNAEAKDEIKKLFADDAGVFITPKPEKLLQRIITIASNPGDIILDSFAGTGTTGAVAHKMGRRWIMVELGDHCHTHIVPRLKKVIDGEDQGGISKAVNWQGGGGFRYLRLAPSLLKKDDWGNWVINKEYNAEMLAEAVCKHMGFTYAPSQTQFWNHGYSTETDHIYVTTGSLAYDQLKRISEEVGNERTLLICCKAFMMDGADFPNLTLKKIPKVILNKCEWDHDDYSFTLNVLPEEQDEEWADDDSEE
ncbi:MULTISPECIES: site-specific DNA-methyltransferase [Aeromonas]|uniref:site-specific DNA-methyltransferase (adenine-specific) n=1 Tax=Aeromonas caviae TaxID=648 RepID=A0AAV4YKI0_AERCA|nr:MULTISPECIES: site-specific DNA-methyltransferase [Aeromonas]AKA18255.1 DNA methylase N-4 [Aeromonas hydrophila]MCA4701825.1 site-specific DNA-methyltransferase [Aeromonas hydrophila]BCM76836.1 site-specific DNA-methyltransferase [Aeromonas caviae]GJA32435.1 site-specific DNA-methyltransferase [Aeromonas caviae]GJA36285.1 site-specific DNA-methyltransferase [Aeromonas caviae]